MTQPWWKRFLPSPAREIPGNATFSAGVVAIGPYLKLCDVADRRRGVKVVTVSIEQAGRIFRLQNQFEDLQAELRAMPKTLKQRRRRVSVVPLPGNPQNEEASVS